MTLIILTSTIIRAATSALLTRTPLSLGAIILYIALITSTTFSISISSWFAYFIFLIYIGGILVIFTYFVAMCPNQSINIKYLIISLLSSFILYTTIIVLLRIINYTSTVKKYYYSYIYLTRNNSILILLLIILLITMVFVVKVTTRSAGPLRPFIYV